ncbi:Trehalose utilization [Polystyrenella longa]|uniref:Trehalose utilization n=1 Tax=Polystyrenella longa TaxID=2528007 RepID=A0A518CGY5_9PLAN|nr:DUF1080 domain-containing protein [Polystyrenella longa]QDU78488.1 Trehalose utilization [Polystyrenella longa]
MSHHSSSILKSVLALASVFLIACTTSLPAAEPEFISIFDGKTLDGWDGNPEFWSVEDGSITGETTKENPTEGNTFIIWRGGEPGDFELELDYKIVGHNSGIQYRSFEVPDQKWVVGGYQADMEVGDMYSGINYGERFRGILALRGQATVIGDDHKPTVVEEFAKTEDLQKEIKKEDWNHYRIVAKDFNFVHYINGVRMSEVTDNDVEQRREKGVLALQLHAGPPMKVQFKNIKLKKLPKVKTTAKENKKIVFVAGTKSHGYGAHEHKAGCMLLAEAIEDNMSGYETTVVTEGWPTDVSVFDGADSIVVYCDGGERHPINQHLEEVDSLMKKGVGLVLIHYAVEVPKDPSGKKFLEWIGGFFEMDWSVNPHWTANFTQFPEHPIASGVKPFQIHDEWYYHMRFVEGMNNVTPILTDIPPKSSLSRPDGPHSGNPYVRAEAGKPQHVAWARERKDGGRGFGFTGGHDHWNWGNDGHRKVVLNAIVWTAGGEVPEAGVASATPTVEELEANQDYPKPDNYNPARIQKMLSEWKTALAN